MADTNGELKEIWGSVPAPLADEVDEAWRMMTTRHMTDPAIGEAGRTSAANRLRLNEFIQASPALFNHMDLLGRRFADATGNPPDARAYSMGVADFVELLGTIAMNRQIKAMELQLPPVNPEAP